MGTEAVNGRAPEDIEGTDFNDAENIPGGGLGADFDVIDAEDDDDDLDLNEDDMINPISMSKADGDDDDDDHHDDDDDDNDDDDDDDDKLDKAMSMGGMTRANLRKAIANLARSATRQNPRERQRELLERSLNKSLSRGERQELMGLLDDTGPRVPRQMDLAKGMRQNSVINDTLDASEFLSAQNAELVKALGQVSKSMASMNNRSQAYNEVLAEAVVRIGQRLDHVAGQLAKAQAAPIAGPKSFGVSGRARPLQKSGMGGGNLSHSEIGKALDGLMQKSISAGRPGQTERGGDLMKAIAHFDSNGGQLLDEVAEDVARFHRETR